MERKLVIFDAMAILHRAFHAIPPLTTKSGEPINAVYGLVSILINVCENLKPTNIIFCFDEKEKTFRSKILSTYQSQRPETSYELSSQFSKARDFLKAAKIPVYSKPGFEADDVIGTIATKIDKKDEMEVVIVTGDRDILQLVNDSKKIRLFMPVVGLSNGKLYMEKETEERLEVKPNQVPDYKALVGDPSDNYFGVPGIGPKTAVNLLTKYKTLNGVYNSIDDLPEKLREKLKKEKESAYLSYKLATIERNVPIEFDLEKSSKWDLDSSEVIELFTNVFGFKTLTVRIKKIGEKIESEKQGSLF